MFGPVFDTQGVSQERDENIVADLAKDVPLPSFVEKKIQIVVEEPDDDRPKALDLSAAHCDEESRRKLLEEELLKIRTSRAHCSGAFQAILQHAEVHVIVSRLGVMVERAICRRPHCGWCVAL